MTNELARLEGLHRDMLAELAPFLRIKTRMLGVPRMTIFRDGHVESDFDYSADQIDVLRQVESFIGEVLEKYEQLALPRMLPEGSEPNPLAEKF